MVLASRDRTTPPDADAGDDADPGRAARVARVLRVATWAQGPPRCLACGGPWRRVPTGMACALCAREVIVRAALRGRD